VPNSFSIDTDFLNAQDIEVSVHEWSNAIR
jgi:hypothetical protein